MPEKKTIKRARKLKREGKSPSTQAGEFVREEIHHVREGKHGARSPNRQSLSAYRRRAEPELNFRPRRKVNRRLRYGVAR